MASAELPPHVSASYGAQPWDRQVNEGEREWSTFLAYRDSAYPEGYEHPYRARDVKALAHKAWVSESTVKGWIASYSWVERAGAFDRMLDQRRIEANATAIERVAYQHQRILDKARIVLEQSIEDLTTKANSGDHLKAREAIALAELVFKYDRLMTGQSTENVHVKHDFDLVNMSLEDTRLLADILARNRLKA